jgi:signal transduction histidine kinase
VQKRRGRSSVARELRVISAALSAVLVVVVLVAAQAFAAYRSQRRIAAAAASQYAAIAAWELARAVRRELEIVASRTVVMPVHAATRETGQRAPMLMYVTKRRVSPECDCPDPLPLEKIFRLDVASGNIGSDTPDDRAPDLATALERVPAEMPEAERIRLKLRQLLDSAEHGVDAPRTGAFIAFDSDSANLAPRVLSVYVARDENSRPLAVYAAVAPLSALDALLKRVVARTALLPALLAPDSAHRMVQVGASVSGVRLLADTDSAPGYHATERIGSGTPALELTAHISHATAARMLPGPLPVTWLVVLSTLMALVVLLLVIARRQLGRSRELDALRGDFVASASHELGTPLALSRVYAETLLREEEGLSAEHRGFVRIILRETTRLARLVENMLRFSELERESVRLASVPVDVSAIVREAACDFEPLARARGTTIVVRAERRVETSGDAGALRQMLFNLLSNAVKYGRADGHVTIDVVVMDDRAEVRVDDDGPGIPREQREFVFDRYTRLHSADESGIGGAGIGLAIVRELADAQGMEARLDSAPGGGTRAIISMKVTGPAPARDASSTPPAALHVG